METSNGIDTKHTWYEGKLIASAGSSVTIEAGSKIVVDYSIDMSHDKPHLNVKLRVAPENKKPEGKDVEKLFGDLHFVEV